MKNKIKELLISSKIDTAVVDTIISNEIFDEILSKEQAEQLVLEKIKEMSVSTEISMRLAKAKAKNIKACTALIDIEKLEYQNGKILGLDEQIEKIVSENPYMFEDFSYTPINGTNKQNEQNMSDSEYFNYLKQNKNGGF